MKKYLYIIKTTFNDSIQYAGSLIFKFFGFIITMLILISLWNFIYSGGDGIIKGYTFNQMIWYLLLAEIITFGSGSKVATDEVKNTIKSGNIAYQVNKPYHYIIYTICKYLADTFIRFIAFALIASIIGIIFAGKIDISFIHIICIIPIFLIGVLINGLNRILISLSSFWVEDSRPFQMAYGKIILIFGVFFPLEMFPGIIQKIIRYSPIYGVATGPAKLVLDFNYQLFIEVLITQIIIILIFSLLIKIIYDKGVKKLNVNGG